MASGLGCMSIKALGPGHKKVEAEVRFIHCNDADTNAAVKFANNNISTTKYSLITFFPKALYEQFRRVANLYFTFVACLSLTPLTPISPITTITPLCAVIGVSIAKEAWEDYKRAKEDKQVNNRLVDVYAGDGKLESRPWKAVRVGDIVRVKKNNFFPADLVFLSSSNAEGSCYVETMNLDGETNLKNKKCLEKTQELKRKTLDQLKARLSCEQPNTSLYTFVGNLDWPAASPEPIPLGPSQLLLRGSSLRNTDYIYGLVIFTGHDSKIMMNQTDPPSKRSRIEQQLDYIIYFMFFLLVLMSTISAIAFGAWMEKEGAKMWYLDPGDTTEYFDPTKSVTGGFLQFLTSIVLYGFFIPISLYVSIEVVKAFQAFFISCDAHMYYEETDKHCVPRTSNLNEELGQVHTILSDKTGTLTRNQMDFFKCTIAGISYGTGVTEIERATAKRLGKDLGAGATEAGGLSPWHEKGFNLNDARLMGGAWAKEARSDVIRRFFQILAVCHTAIPEGDPTPDAIRYQAESPDEAAFVVAAKKFGFFFHKRSAESIWVHEDHGNGTVVDCKYDVLNVLEFNSTRKRMSVVVRSSSGQLLLFCKGADSVIYERLSATGNEFRGTSAQHMGEYGDAGLRTLCLAFAELDEGVYADWQRRWMAAKTTVVSADVQAAALEALAEEIEQNLVLSGCTAIEDKLQEGVPECIDSLARAGLKLWVLTGDKLETAINIGYACSLLRQGMEKAIVVLDSDPAVSAAEASGDREATRTASMASVGRQLADAAAARAKGAAADPFFAFALVIDGKALTYALDDALRAQFLALAQQCDSVICCRVSPRQKALVTLMVKKGTGKICLGIGDGANDVGMIQAADIGVGISGVEGQQAVMASDFAISQFRFLERLLLVHGGWCYKRISRMVSYFFYKNMVFGLTLFWFNAFAFFSGQTIYHDWYLTIYNVVFTSLPVVIMGVLDQDVSARTRLRFPALYQQGQRNLYFGPLKVGVWMLNGLYQSIVCFAFVTLLYRMWPERRNGHMVGLFGAGTTLYTVVVICVNCQIAVAIQYWTWLHHLAIWGSISLWFIFLLVIGIFPIAYVGVARALFVTENAPSAAFWLLLPLVLAAALLPDFTVRSFLRRYWPEHHHICQELEQGREAGCKRRMQHEEAAAVVPTQIGCSAAAEDIRRRSSSVADWQEDDSMTVEAGSSPRPRSCLVAGDRNRVVELQHIPDHGRDVKHVRTKSGDAKSGEPKLVIEV